MPAAYQTLAEVEAELGGVRNVSYRAPRDGLIGSWHGETVVTMPDGRKWLARGCKPHGGSPEHVGRRGGIEFTAAP